MIPVLLATYLNATSAVDRSGLFGEGTPTDGNTWASAIPSTCSLQEETTTAPAAGDTGCTASHGEGAVAWNYLLFCQDSSDWLMYCIGDTWTAATGNTMSEFSADQKWALVQPDTVNTQPDTPESWQRGTFVAHNDLNTRCDDAVPSGWRNGGGLYVCVEALKTGQFVGAICNLGKADDTPACATGFNTLNGGSITTTTTDPCPRQA